MSIRDTGIERRAVEERAHSMEFDPAEDRARQEFRDESTMDSLVKKWMDGQLKPPSYTSENYGDFTRQVTLQDAFDAVERTKEEFMNLSSDARKFFEHDPVKMVSFLNQLQADPEDDILRGQAKKYGVVEFEDDAIERDESSPSTPGSELPPAGQSDEGA